MGYIVKLSKASSGSGVAYLGGNGCQGFNTEQREQAHRFNEYDAQRFASHLQGQWRGFYGFSPENITVEAA